MATTEENVKLLLEQQVLDLKRYIEDFEGQHLNNIRNIALLKAIFAELRRLDPSSSNRAHTLVSTMHRRDKDGDNFDLMLKQAHEIIGL